ncbi:MAG TPA: hypothetical protein PKD38_18945 [Nitrospira sp.]|nr:hypothetical protein [Nitrospira sp.]
MNAALEFHDSEASLVAGADGKFRVLFSAAYIHRSLGRPGVDAGAGYIQPAELVFSVASWTEPTDSCVGNLSDGCLFINGKKLSLIPLPFSASGQVSAELVFTSGATLSVSASSVVCTCTGEPRFVENYAG